MIKVYPSILSENPIETHTHGHTTLHAWLLAISSAARSGAEPQFFITMNGHRIPQDEWALCSITPNDDVRLYPTPHGAIGSVIGKLFSFIGTLLGVSTTTPTSNTNSQTGDDLNTANTAKANTAALGDPIREVFGRMRVYPDYVVPPRSRFDPDDPSVFYTNLFLCVGVGNFAFAAGDIRIGDTPISAFGTDVDYAVYPPGADVSSDLRSENWYVSGEVGGTNSANGLDMGSTAPESEELSADSATVSGTSVSFNSIEKVIVGDDDEAVEKLPDSWTVGSSLNITIPADFNVTTDGGYSRLASDTLAEIAPSVGMAVTLTYNGSSYDLFIAAYTPHADAQPANPGTASSLLATAVLSTYDFTGSGITLGLSLSGNYVGVPLDSNYTDLAGLVAHINTLALDIGVTAQDASGYLKIYETGPTYTGNPILFDGIDSGTFTSTTGTKTTSATDAVTASVTLAYTSATGTAFGGVATGAQRLAMNHRGSAYRILTIDATTITVGRLLEGSDSVDTTWPGFENRTALDFNASGLNDSDLWLGPFLACPASATTSYFEVNFSFPSGLVDFRNSDGSKKSKTVSYEIQYRAYGSGDGWVSQKGSMTNKTIDGCGYTVGITLSSPQLVEVRCRRTNEQGYQNARDSMYWQALQSALQVRPASYPDVTTIGLKVVVGGKLSAQSDRKINIVATRVYDEGTARSLSGAFRHLTASAGMTTFDTATVDSLEASYWTPNGIQFDYIADKDSTSVKDVLDIIAAVGRGYFTISDGVGTVGLNIAKSWTGVITPQEATGPMETTATAITDDDYDGVDVTYTSSQTWADEIVQCRLPGADTARKVESVNADGITDQDKAYQFGMRRLMAYQLQRMAYSVGTEMDALNYEYGDRVILADDIVGMKTLTALAESFSVEGGVTTLVVSEPFDWTWPNPRVVIRLQDGSASGLLVPTRIDDFTLSVPGDFSYDLDPSIEPIRVMFCDSSRAGYNATISKISPDTDGTCSVEAVQYDEGIFEYDNATYPGDVD